MDVPLEIGGAFVIVPILAMAVNIAVFVVAAVALWRIMKAQELAAHALQRIADSFRPKSG